MCCLKILTKIYVWKNIQKKILFCGKISTTICFVGKFPQLLFFWKIPQITFCWQLFTKNCFVWKFSQKNCFSGKFPQKYALLDNFHKKCNVGKLPQKIFLPPLPPPPLSLKMATFKLKKVPRKKSKKLWFQVDPPPFWPKKNSCYFTLNGHPYRK